MQENYHNILDNAGIRPSVQRVAVYSYLCEKKNHPTVEMVYADLAPSYPTLSRTTIYNTLKLFEEKHIVQSIQIEDDKLRYDANMVQHIHFKCEQCGNVFDLFCDELISDYSAQYSKLLPQGYSVSKTQTNIWGTCVSCKKNGQ